MTRRFARCPLFLTFALLFMAALSKPGSAGVFNPETLTLNNGMKVVMISNHRAPVVTHMVWYKVGAADEGPGETGIAHFLEHLMFKGTSRFKPGEFSKTLARHGGQENAFTSYDYTAYFQTVASDRLEMVMEMEADRMTGLILTEEIIAPERQVVLEERRSRVDNNPSSILREQTRAASYLNHPYRRPVIGWEHEIAGLDLKRILAFYKRWYAPNNAILVVAGDITMETLKPLAEKYYGSIPAANTPERIRPTEPPQKSARTVSLKDPRVRQARWSRSYLAPGQGTLKSPDESDDIYALEVLSEIISGGSSSRLYKSLVVDGKLAQSAGSYYSGDGFGPGRFGFYASPRPGIPFDQIEMAIDIEIAKILKDGVTEDELNRATTRMQDEAIYARDSQSGGARALGAALASGSTIDDVESWPERIGSVTLAGVQAAAQKVFIESNSVTALLQGLGKGEQQ